MTFEELLLKLKVTENDYRLAVRSSPNTPTVFLKRKPDELRINNYNHPYLKAWRANMDIQFVLDVYQCAMYRVSYISIVSFAAVMRVVTQRFSPTTLITAAKETNISKAQKEMSERFFPQVIVINKTTSSDIKAIFAKNYL